MKNERETKDGLSRRQMLAVAGMLSLAGQAARAAGARPKVTMFSKHLHFLQGEALAQGTKEIGFDALDLTVRKGGHVEPDRVAEDLPPLVGILRRNGVEVPMVTSGIVDAETPQAEAVLRTIAKLGIRYYRWGGFRYEASRPILEQLDALRARVAKLAALNAKYQVCAMYHTHSGLGQVGASIWDLYLLLKEFDPNVVSVNYDIGHATIEGGYGGWINSLRVTVSHLKGVAVKDFLWGKNQQGEWRPQWRPLGEGMVRFPEFFKMLSGVGFSGPLQVHYEYPLGGADTGKTTLTMGREQVYAAMRQDLVRLLGWMKEAGLA